MTAAWKFAKKGIKEVQAEAARQVAAVQATAQREVQKIQSDNVADEMLQASYTAVKEADAEAQKVKDTLEASVQEAERLRNTNVALLKHLDASRVEREQLTMQLPILVPATPSSTTVSITALGALTAAFSLTMTTRRMTPCSTTENPRRPPGGSCPTSFPRAFPPAAMRRRPSSVPAEVRRQRRGSATMLLLLRPMDRKQWPTIHRR